MPRVPYADVSSKADNSNIVDRIVARRGSDELLELDRMLLHSPKIAGGWNEFLGAIRAGTTLADDVREFIICRVAVLNKARYEWDQHLPLLQRALAKSEIDSQDVIAMLRNTARTNTKTASDSTGYVDLLHYVDAMTSLVKVPDEIFTALRTTLLLGDMGDQTMVEITATCAAYNCVSRFLVALHVGDSQWAD